MKRLLVYVLFFSICLTAIPKTSSALSGGYFSYHLKQDSLYIYLTLMRECSSGAYANTTNISLAPITGNCGTFTTTLTRESITDFTPTCDTTLNSCSGGSFGPAHEAHLYKGVVYLGGSRASCCKWGMSWTSCCRPAGITSGQGSSNIYIDAEVNHCLVSENYSPVFTPQAGILCRNQDASLFVGGNDTAEQNIDSVVYTSIFPKPCMFFSCSGTYTPLTYLGSPNPNAPSPLGFHLNTNTGDLVFRPTVAGQRGVIGIQAVEWRKINNKWEEIGRVYNDFEIEVINCSNLVPKLPTIVTHSVCVGDTLSFDITSSDPDTTDSTYVSWNNNIQGATFTTNNGQVRNAKGTFTWIPTLQDTSDLPYKFTVTVNDSVCPRNGQSSKTYLVEVKKPLPTSFRTTNLNCGTYRFDQNANSPYPNITSSWSINGVSVGVKKVLEHTFFRPGSYQVKAFMLSGTCVTTLYDTIQIDSADIILTDLPDQEIICPDDSAVFSPNILGGLAPYQYEWTDVDTIIDTLATVQYFPSADTTLLFLEITDSLGCIGMDTVLVMHDTVPQADAGMDTTICAGVTLPLTGLPAGGIWSGPGMNGATFQHLTPGIHEVFYSVDNGRGCITTDTALINVLPLPVIQTGSYPNVCEGSTAILLNGLPSGGNWSGMHLNGNQFNPSIVGLFDLQYLLTDSNGCTDSAITQIKVNPLPTAQAGSYPDICLNSPSINLMGTPTGGLWIGNHVSGNLFNPDSAGTFDPQYLYTDSNGCVDTAITQIKVNPLPNVEAGIYADACLNSAPIALNPLPDHGSWDGWGINNNTFTPDSVNTFTLEYTYTDSNQCSNIDLATITVNPLPEIDFNASIDSGAAPLSINFINLSPTGTNQWLWNFGDPNSGSQNTSTVRDPSHTFSQQGLYSIKVVGTDSITGCIDSLIRTDYILVTQSTGIGYIEAVGKLQINPNPALQSFIIAFDRADNYSIEVLDVQGKVVLEKKVNQTQQTVINRGMLSKGGYLIKAIDTKGKIYLGRLILE